MKPSRIRCAIVGYGPAYDWGRVHARWLQAVPEMEVVAICDQNPECVAKARQDFPDVFACTDLKELLRRADIDLVAIVTPHNTHAPLAIACLEAGKHTVVEKPMCITIAEATEMVETAKRADRTLAVFHNRRHDGNVRAIRRVVQSGEIGDVFHIEVTGMRCGGSFTYDRPGEPWRASKAISGGALYDWGSHAVDWVLSMVPSRMTQVTGFFHKFRPEQANEDQTRAILRFENGCVAEILQSRVAQLGRPYLWLLLGTKGAIMDSGRDAIKGYCEEVNGPSGGSFLLRTAKGESEIPYLESDWATYYADLANHLLRGGPVPVSGEDGRRVIAVLQTAEKSAASGHSEPVPYP
ncbi:Gfo/Idh/MocA family protein [Verrucomicrobiota bacterium]